MSFKSLIHLHYRNLLPQLTFNLKHHVRSMTKGRSINKKKATGSQGEVKEVESEKIVPYIKRSSKGLLRLEVKVIPNAKVNSVKVQGEELTLHLTAKPVDNQANSQVLKLMAEILTLKPYQLELVSGSKSRHKVIQLIDSSSFNSESDLQMRIRNYLSTDQER